eukprot:m.94347 g.94347  ORF g.94347 m.94347 type:complete len:52 (+) comp12229_c0_seq2:70-225(+)
MQHNGGMMNFAWDLFTCEVGAGGDAVPGSSCRTQLMRSAYAVPSHSAIAFF